MPVKSQPKPNPPELRIRRQKRRSLLMQPTPQGGYVVYIPHWMSPDSPEVQRFIAEGRRKLAAQRPAPRPEITPPDQVRALFWDWAARMDLRPARLTLRDMRRKWGSCSTKGNITLNTALCTLDRPLVSYVIVHELAHLLVFDHSPAFWAVVGQWVPDYPALVAQLHRISPV